MAAEHADIDTVVTAQGGSRAVRARLEALATATCSLVLFCEYIPHSITKWLRTDPAGKAVSVERQLVEIVAFLRDREVLPMDGHFGNIRTDGGRVYLSDFGLATSTGSTCRRRSATSRHDTAPMTPATPPCAWSTGW